MAESYRQLAYGGNPVSVVNVRVADPTRPNRNEDLTGGYVRNGDMVYAKVLTDRM